MSLPDEPVPSQTECAAIRATFALRPQTFVYLTSSDALSWAQRKNPLGVLDAFESAFPGDEDVALLVKTRNLGGALTSSQLAIWNEIKAACARDARIVLVDDFLDPIAQRTLLAASDCYVSLHRAEGLGLDVFDAFDLGVAVVATAYSGATEYATPETAWLVPAIMTPVESSSYCYVRARPRLGRAGPRGGAPGAARGPRRRCTPARPDRRGPGGRRLGGEPGRAGTAARPGRSRPAVAQHDSSRSRRQLDRLGRTVR